MRTLIPWGVALLIGLLPGLVPAAEEETGRALVEAMTGRHHLPYEFQEAELRQELGDLRPEPRRLRRYSRQEGEGMRKHLLVLDAPAPVRGVSLLAWQYRGGVGDVWIFLPSLGSGLRRMAPGAGGGRLLDTDFALEDLLPENPALYRYRRLSDQTLEDVSCAVVEAVPALKEVRRLSSHARRRLFLRLEDHFLMRVEHLDGAGRVERRLLNLEPQAALHGALRPRRIRVEALRQGGFTELEVFRMGFTPEEVPAEIFSKARIRAGGGLTVTGAPNP